MICYGMHGFLLQLGPFVVHHEACRFGLLRSYQSSSVSRVSSSRPGLTRLDSARPPIIIVV